MAIRLVASDLDGTLFGADHLPQARTVAAVNALADKGLVIAAVTGRSHFAGVTRAISTGARLDYFIGSNGGHRINVATGEVEERLVFPASFIAELQQTLSAVFGDVGFGFEHHDGFSYTPAFIRHHPSSFGGGPRIGTSANKTMDSIGKIMVSHPPIITTDLVRAVTPYVPEDVVVATSGVSFVEITPAGADKGAGLARLAAKLGISADEVIAFGDNHNDLTMVEWAGRGVAMGNALDEVKACANEVTATNIDFGVAKVLEALA